MAKWDSIDKHVGKRKNFDGKWYMDPKCGGMQKMKSHMFNYL
jgi:hypothetical protein